MKFVVEKSVLGSWKNMLVSVFSTNICYNYYSFAVLIGEFLWLWLLKKRDILSHQQWISSSGHVPRHSVLGLWWSRSEEALPRANVLLKPHCPYEVILSGLAGKVCLWCFAYLFRSSKAALRRESVAKNLLLQILWVLWLLLHQQSRTC